MRAIILAAFVCAYAPNAHSQGAAAVPVGVVQAELRPIAKTLDFVGRVDAINRVDIRARVKGYLEAVLFKEGDLVKEGQPLYRIEKGLFQAAVEQAQGRLQTGKAQHELAVKNRQRQEELFAKNVSAGKQLDEAVASEGEAKGAIMTNEADLQTAQINLGYTDIVAPIAGKIGRTALTKGNVVSPDSGVLTTIVSLDPMYVTFPVSQREFLRATQTGRATDVKSIKAQIRFSDGSLYDQLGEINFVDVTVDRCDRHRHRTGYDAQSERPPDRRPAGARQSRERDARREGYDSTVSPDRRSERRLCIRGRGRQGGHQTDQDRRRDGANVVVEAGLTAGEQVIVEGLQAVRPGVAVRASPVPPAVRQD